RLDALVQVGGSRVEVVRGQDQPRRGGVDLGRVIHQCGDAAAQLGRSLVRSQLDVDVRRLQWTPAQVFVERGAGVIIEVGVTAVVGTAAGENTGQGRLLDEAGEIAGPTGEVVEPELHEIAAALRRERCR